MTCGLQARLSCSLELMKILVWSLLLFFLTVPSCQSVPKNFDAPPSVAIRNTQETFWGRYYRQEIETYKNKSGFYPLQAGTDALVARLESIRRAEKALDFQYYIWHDDDIGKMMWSELLKAADRGVRVRLLLDDLNIGPYQEPLLILDSHRNIEVRMFNPFAHRYWRVFDVFRFSEVNRRMHNKAIIADNQTVIIGGRNIGREYFTASSESNFGDFDVWCFGPVVEEASRSFDMYWNDRLAIPVSALYRRQVQEGELPALKEELAEVTQGIQQSDYQKTLDDAELTKNLKKGKLTSFWGRAKVFADSPAKIRGEENKNHPPMLNQVTALPIKSEKEIFIVSPYFIPGRKGVGYFEKKIKSGVKVDVFTNSLASNDVGLVFAGYKRYRKDLIRAGVSLYEMKPKVKTKKKSSMGITSGARLGLHGKVYIFDRRVMFVGSMNLDPRSVDLNSELGVLFESPELANAFVSNTLQELPDIAYKVTLTEKNRLRWFTQEDGEEVVVESEPEASRWKSFKSGFLGLFVPESLL